MTMHLVERENSSYWSLIQRTQNEIQRQEYEQAICWSRDGVPKDILLLNHFLEPGAACP